MDVQFRAEPGAGPVADGPALSDEKRLAVYRIAQEALNNALQHADPARVDLGLGWDGTALHLSVTDDGAGPPDADPLSYAADGHYGLLGMSERADLLRADLAVGPGPAGGTRVSVAVPVALHRLPAPAAAGPPVAAASA